MSQSIPKIYWFRFKMKMLSFNDITQNHTTLNKFYFCISRASKIEDSSHFTHCFCRLTTSTFCIYLQ